MMEVLRYILCGFFMSLITFFAIQGNNLGVIVLVIALIIVALWDTIFEVTANLRNGRITLKRDLKKVGVDVEKLTKHLDELYMQEVITDAKQLDKDGNYTLLYEPIKLSTVVYTGVLGQHEGLNFLLEGRKLILQDWWQNKKPEEFIKPDHPLVIRYMKKIGKIK